MADIFITYAREDKEKVAILAKALNDQGFKVWWDLEIRSGEQFDRKIEEEIKNTGSVLAVWSHHSVDSNWVRAEAAEGYERGILISVAIDPSVKLPVQFKNVHTEPLIDFDGKTPSRSFDKIVADIHAVINKQEPPNDTKIEPTEKSTPTPKSNSTRKASSIKSIFAIVGLTLLIITTIVCYQNDLFIKLWEYDPFLVYYIIGTLALLIFSWVLLKFTDSNEQSQFTIYTYIFSGILVAIAVIWRGILVWAYILNSNCDCKTPQCQPPHLYTSHNFLPYVALVVIAIVIVSLLIFKYGHKPAKKDLGIYFGIFLLYLLICRIVWEIVDRIALHYKPPCF